MSQPNKTPIEAKEEIEIEVCGKTYTIKRDFDLIRRIETALDRGIMAIGMQASQFELPLSDLAQLIRQMVRHEKGAPSVEDIGTYLVQFGTQAYLADIGGFLVRTYVGHKDEDKFEKDAPEGN